MNESCDVLVFGAHPDDVELGCGGTVAKLVSVGASAVIVDLTRGELGTRGSADLRDEESYKAASILGVQTGQKIGQRLQGSELKTLLALLMLSVGVLMAYNTFFRNGADSPAIKIPTDKIVEISEFGNTVFTISEKYPIVYGASSIFLALVAGVAASFVRKKLSQWRTERLNKPGMY